MCPSFFLPPILSSCKDLEEEAIKLRESKKSITDKAQMLLQTLSVSGGREW